MRWSPIYADWLSSVALDEPAPVEDSAVLDEAERHVRTIDPMATNVRDSAGWATAMKPVRVGGYLINPGANAFVLTSCLDSANIPYLWDPYPPQLMPMYRPGDGAIDRPFSLYVPPADLEDASALLAESGVATSDWSAFSAPITAARSDEAEYHRLSRFFLVMAMGYAPQLISFYAAAAVLHALNLLRIVHLLPAAVRVQLHRWFG